MKMRSLVVALSAVGLSALVTLPGGTTAQRNPPRLLFAEQIGDICNIRYWYDGAAEAVLLARIDKCPESLFVDRSRRTVFVIDGGEIRAIQIYPVTELDRTRLPKLDYRSWLDQMTLRPDENSNYQPGIENLRPIGVRFFDDGTLGVAMSLRMPADDEYHYLFKHGEGGWTVVASRWCERWGCDDPADRSQPFHSLNYLSTQDAESWPETRMIWHPALVLNKYVTYRKEEKHENSPGKYSGMVVEVGLKISGSEAVLTGYVSPSEHSEASHTLNVDLLVDSGSLKNLSENQCLTSVVGRYILVREFFGGRFELTDMSTGETVFSNLNTAGWID